MEPSRDVSSLAILIDPVSPRDTVESLGERFRSGGFGQCLCLPVVDEGIPVGTISRYRLMQIFISLFGRELYGRRSVAGFMNSNPLVVEVRQSMALASQYVTENIEFPLTEDFIITRDGRYHGMGMVLDLLKAMEQQVVRHTGELTTAYHKLQSSQAQLVQSEKMASLGQMVAGVAHEINTPLGYVRNNVEMVRDTFSRARELLSAHYGLTQALISEQADENELNSRLGQVLSLHQTMDTDATCRDMDELLQDTIHGVAEISDLVVNLKNFSRLDQARVSEVNLNECLDSALIVGKNALKYKATILKEYGELPRIPCSPSQINQVFLNLLTNAVQAIEDKGRILLKTWFDDDNVFVSIQDTGKGIPKDDLSRIFDPFFTTKEIGQGTGLGLSICYQIVRQHGGEIRVASEVGRGSRFVVSLPRRMAAFKQAV